MKGILGKKIGMLQVFDNHGKAIAVTLVDIRNNNVLEVKTKEQDGYNALKIGFEEKNVDKINKPMKGIFNKAKVTARAFIKEIRDMSGFEIGEVINPNIFKNGEYVDVQGYSKGQGFTGSIKRHNHSRGPMGHGSGYHRGVGSMGSITSNKIPKGKKMPGRMGNELSTLQNLQIVKVNEKDGYILIKGSIVGPKNSYVVIKESVKKPNVIKPFVLATIRDENLLREILETAKHYGVTIDLNMTMEEMQDKINEAKAATEANMANQEKIENADSISNNNVEKVSENNSSEENKPVNDAEKIKE